jgi:hypothetical protein
MFLQYIVVFLSRDVLNQFQLRGCTLPPPQFLYGFSLFQRMFFLRLGVAVAPPWLRHCLGDVLVALGQLGIAQAP